MKKKNYTPPRLTVAVFKQERGYANSYRLGLTAGDPGDQFIENREESGSWGSGEWNF
jgi:hypothetical protein